MILIESKATNLLEEKKEANPVQKYDIDYQPSEREDFMNLQMKSYFSQKINSMIGELEAGISDYLNNQLKENLSSADYMDRASISVDQDLKLSMYNSQCDLLQKARLALQRLELDTYGYCAVTGLPISVRRLMANPVADMGLKGQG